jgi:alanine racemase
MTTAPTARIEIDLAALRRNVAALSALIGPACKVLAVVKSDGYGHGLIDSGRAAVDGGARRLGVSTVEEGIALRAANLGCPILVMGPIADGEAAGIVAHRLTPVIHRPGQLAALAAAVDHLPGAAGRATLPVHLKVDTGMGRLGLLPGEFPSALEQARAAPELAVEGVMTHFAEADVAGSAYTADQQQQFLSIIAQAAAGRPPQPPIIAHAANSAALLTRPESRLQMVRAGLAIYGVLPAPHCRGIVELEPVMRWTTRLAHLRRLESGRSIGYGRSFTTTRPSLIGLLPMGYAAGYPRLLSNRAVCLHDGARLPVVGRVSMDLTMIDLTDHPAAAVGDEIVLLGSQGEGRVTAEELAGWAQTIPYEILCAAGGRNPRCYLESATRPPSVAAGRPNR